MHVPRILPAGRPLHVLQVDPNANTPPYDRALGRALVAEGCRVDLLTSRFLYENLDDPGDLHVAERFFRLAGSELAGRLGLANRPTLRRLLKAGEYPLDWMVTLARITRRRPDVIHVQWSFQPELDLLLWRVLRRLRVPLVYTVHNLIPHDARPADATRYGRLYRAADALVVHSRRSARALQERWEISPDRIVDIRMGPMLENWPPLPRDQARHVLGLPADAELILFCGLIEPYKGLADLIAAFALVAARRPLARLAIAGKPNEPFELYERQLRGLGLLDRTVLDLRFLPEEWLTAFLCAADVVVLPYRSVTSSAMLLAARRFGRPVVATDVGDLGEIIVDGESGLLVPPSCPDQLAVAIERLLSDRTLAARLGAAGQQAAFGSESWAEAARRTLTLYRRLLG